jgi:phosphoglycolate phosphatase
MAVLFDLDGTLINTLPDITGIVNWVRRDLGLKTRSVEFVCKFVGKGAESLIAGCFSDLEASRKDAVSVEKFRALYCVKPHHGGSVYPGVPSILKELRSSGYALGIASNKPEKNAKVTLEYYLPGFVFDIMAFPENVSAKKPSPLHLTEPLDRLGVEACSAYFVGDDPVDACAAEAAGVSFIGAGYGYGGVSAPVMIRHFNELPALLSQSRC